MKSNMKKKRRIAIRWIFVIITAIIMQVSACAVAFIVVLTSEFSKPLGIVTSVTYLGILIVGLGTSIAAIFSRRILKPIYKINEVTKQIAAGNFTVRLDETSRIKEVAEIAKSFNIMVRELANTETLRNDFVSNVSHEFKTPLAAVEGYCMLLQESDLEESERQKYITHILDNVERLTGLTHNTLALSRLDYQEIVIEKEYYDVGEQIRRILLSYENLWQEKNLEIELEIDDIKFCGNKALMAQVWSNLIDNAIKFSNQNGILRIECHKVLDEVSVVIQDNGIGMSVETMKHAFDRFYQGDESHKTKGNGLGLALVKKIISICEGIISVESKLGEGTSFYITLKSK